MADTVIIKPGEIYAGELLSKDRSSHHKFVIYLVNTKGIIYSFALTSEKDTINYLKLKDPDAVVPVPKELIDKIYKKNPKDTWIYCGEGNINRTLRTTVEEAIRNSELVKLDITIGQELYEEIDDAVYNSMSYSDDAKRELGFKLD